MHGMMQANVPKLKTIQPDARSDKINMELPAMPVKSKAQIMSRVAEYGAIRQTDTHCERNPKPAEIVHCATVNRFISGSPADFPRAHLE